MIIQISVCYKCPDRKLGCHAICEKYIAECEKSNKIREKIIEERKRRDDIYNYRRRQKGREL